MEVGAMKSSFGEMRTGTLAAPATADPTKEAEKKGVFSMKGDTVDITEEGKKLATQGMVAPESAQKSEEKEEAKAENPLVKSAKDRIKQLQEEMKELEQSDLPEKEKQQKIAMLQQEITLQNKILEDAQKAADGMDKKFGKNSGFTASAS